MRYIAMLMLCLSTMYAQYPIQRPMTIPRGDARTLEFETGTDVQGDSIVFAVTLYYQETYNLSDNLTLRRSNKVAWDGDDEQIFVTDSTNGTLKVYLSRTNTLTLTERRYYYSLRVNDTTKYFGTLKIATTGFVPAALTYLTTADSARFLAQTHPALPNLIDVPTADSNRVMCIDANGNLYKCWDDGGAGSAVDQAARDTASLANTQAQTNEANKFAKADTNALHQQKFATPNPFWITFQNSDPSYIANTLFSKDGKLSIFGNEPDITGQIMEELWLEGRNITGSTILNGQVVYQRDVSGQLPTIDLAQSDSTTTSRVLGIATHDIEQNTNGFATTFGLVHGLNTSNYGNNTVVYLSPDTAGLFTLVKPVSPNQVIEIGTVIFSHNTLGVLQVRIHIMTDTSGFNQGDITDAMRITYDAYDARITTADDTAKAANVRSATNRILLDLADDTAKVANVRSATNAGDLATHESNTSNPHSVTAAQAGAIAPGDGTLADSTLIPGTGVTFDVEGANITINAAGGGGGDSARTRLIDSTGTTVDQGDTLRFRKTRIFLPEFMPDHSETTSYDSQKKAGWIEYEVIIGGNNMRSATSPAFFSIITDSASGVSLRYIEVIHRDIEATTQGLGNRCVEYLTFSNTTGTGAATRKQQCLATGEEVNFFPHTLGTRNRMDVLVTSSSENVSYTHATIRVGFVMDLANESDFYVGPLNH